VLKKMGDAKWTIGRATGEGAKDAEAASKALDEAVEGMQKVVLRLLQSGAKLSSVRESYDWRGCGSQETAMEMATHVAIEYGLDKLLEACLKFGGNPNSER
jgi:hypothetical protein